jgi:tRNA threonylcarbamoyl adenosine modification protein (Sua5/YciO/YrdC/YwlC family)
MLLKIHPENPEMRKIAKAVDILRKGGVIIYPTDTLYGLGCDIHNSRALERICRIKGIKMRKSNFSFICNDLSHLSEYTAPIENSTFRLLKKAMPGPFTFILKASATVAKLFKNNKKTVGIRIPDTQIAQMLVKELGRPILSTTLNTKEAEMFLEYYTDPEDIYDEYQHLVDLVIDGGYGNQNPSTVVDCSNGNPVILRQGIGILHLD